MSYQGFLSRITNLTMAAVYAAVVMLATIIVPATSASAVIAPLPAPTPPTANPATFCDWMGELHYSSDVVSSGQPDIYSTRQSTSTEDIDMVTAQVPGESCGMLWSGERNFSLTQQSPTIPCYNWAMNQKGTADGTGSFSFYLQFTSNNPVWLGVSPTTKTGGTILETVDYQSPQCGTSDSTYTSAWTPSVFLSDCVLEDYVRQGIFINATSQATVGKCTKNVNISNASETTVVKKEFSWRFKKINCNTAVNSDGGSKSDCQEYDDNTNPMDATDDPVAPTDTTAPTITLNSPINGGTVTLGSSATASYTCQDEASGSTLASCNSSIANGATLDTSTLGVKTFTVTATDIAGNTNTATASYTVTPPPDTTKPTITLNIPLNGGTVLLGSTATASFSCQDEAGGSGLASCSSPVANGAALDTSTVGTRTFVVTATDNAGNVETATASYTVQYQHSGFLGPVDSNAVNKTKAGQTVPVQFRLLDGNGNPISNASSFVSLTSVGTTCSSSDTLDAIEQYSGGSGLQYLGDGYWQYNWKTAKTYAGQCRIIYLNLADGSKASAKFQF